MHRITQHTSSVSTTWNDTRHKSIQFSPFISSFSLSLPVFGSTHTHTPHTFTRGSGGQQCRLTILERCGIRKRQFIFVCSHIFFFFVRSFRLFVGGVALLLCAWPFLVLANNNNNNNRNNTIGGWSHWWLTCSTIYSFNIYIRLFFLFCSRSLSLSPVFLLVVVGRVNYKNVVERKFAKRTLTDVHSANSKHTHSLHECIVPVLCFGRDIIRSLSLSHPFRRRRHRRTPLTNDGL